MAAVRSLTLSPTARRLAALRLCSAHLNTRTVSTDGVYYSKREGFQASCSGDESVNSAARELGVTTYYCNRNPRSLELLGMAEKPKGFQTARRRVDYYHR